jgi:hypothetical protein
MLNERAADVQGAWPCVRVCVRVCVCLRETVCMPPHVVQVPFCLHAPVCVRTGRCPSRRSCCVGWRMLSLRACGCTAASWTVRRQMTRRCWPCFAWAWGTTLPPCRLATGRWCVQCSQPQRAPRVLCDEGRRPPARARLRSHRPPPLPRWSACSRRACCRCCAPPPRWPWASTCRPTWCVQAQLMAGPHPHGHEAVVRLRCLGRGSGGGVACKELGGGGEWAPRRCCGGACPGDREVHPDVRGPRQGLRRDRQVQPAANDGAGGAAPARHHRRCRDLGACAGRWRARSRLGPTRKPLTEWVCFAAVCLLATHRRPTT